MYLHMTRQQSDEMRTFDDSNMTNSFGIANVSISLCFWKQHVFLKLNYSHSKMHFFFELQSQMEMPQLNLLIWKDPDWMPTLSVIYILYLYNQGEVRKRSQQIWMTIRPILLSLWQRM